MSMMVLSVSVNYGDGEGLATKSLVDSGQDIKLFMEESSRALIHALEEAGKITPVCRACAKPHKTSDCPELA